MKKFLAALILIPSLSHAISAEDLVKVLSSNEYKTAVRGVEVYSITTDPSCSNTAALKCLKIQTYGKKFLVHYTVETGKTSVYEYSNQE